MYKDIFIHLNISIKLFMFERLQPTENNNVRFFPFMYGLSMFLCTFKSIFIRIDAV